MKRRIRSLLSEKELILNSGMVFGAGFIGAIFLFISNLVLARVFGPEVFGNYKTILGLFIFIPALVDFGASLTLTKYIAEFKAKKEDGKINHLIRFFLKLKIISIFSLVVLVYFFRDLFAHIFLKDPSLSYLIVPGLILSLFMLFEVTKPIIAGFQNFRLFSFSNFLTPASTGVATIVFGYYFGLYYAILGWPVGYVVGNLPNVWFMLKEKFLHKNGVKLEIKQIFRNYSIPMWGMYLLNMSNTMIIPILSLFFAQKLIGYYGFAWTFYSGIVLIPMALSQVLFPKISEMNGKKDFKNAKSTLIKVFAIYTPIVITGIIGILLFSRNIINLIAPEYLSGLFVFKVLNVTGLLLGYLFILNNYYNGRGKIKKSVLTMVLYNLLLLMVSLLSLVKI